MESAHEEEREPEPQDEKLRRPSADGTSPEASIIEICGKYASKCGYCKKGVKSSVSYGIVTHQLTCAEYQALINRGWRRSGTFVYKPIMKETCCPQYTIRVDVNQFRIAKSQRQALNRLSRYLEGSLPLPVEENGASHDTAAPGDAALPSKSACRALASEGGGSRSSAVAGSKERSEAAMVVEEGLPSPPGASNSKSRQKYSSASSNGDDSARGSDPAAEETARALSAAVQAAVVAAGRDGVLPLPPLEDLVASQKLSEACKVRPNRQATLGDYGCAVALKLSQLVNKGSGAARGGAELRAQAATEQTQPHAALNGAAAQQSSVIQAASAVPAPEDEPAAVTGSDKVNSAAAIAAALVPYIRRETAADVREAQNGFVNFWVRSAPSGSADDGVVDDKKEGGARSRTASSSSAGGGAPPQRQKKRKGKAKSVDLENRPRPTAAPSGGAPQVPLLQPRHRLTFETVPAQATDEVVALYRKYQMCVHGDKLEDLSVTSFHRFLVDSPLLPQEGGGGSGSGGAQNGGSPRQNSTANTPLEGATLGGPLSEAIARSGVEAAAAKLGTYHQLYRLDGRLVAVSVVDVLPQCLSSVYCFYDPDYRALSLGRLSALGEIEWAWQAQATRSTLHYYYLGFYIHTCPKMSYKGAYHPSQLLCPEQFTWEPLDECRGALDLAPYVALSQIMKEKPTKQAGVNDSAESSRAALSDMDVSSGSGIALGGQNSEDSMANGRGTVQNGSSSPAKLERESGVTSNGAESREELAGSAGSEEASMAEGSDDRDSESSWLSISGAGDAAAMDESVAAAVRSVRLLLNPAVVVTIDGLTATGQATLRPMLAEYVSMVGPELAGAVLVKMYR